MSMSPPQAKSGGPSPFTYGLSKELYSFPSDVKHQISFDIPMSARVALYIYRYEDEPIDNPTDLYHRVKLSLSDSCIL